MASTAVVKVTLVDGWQEGLDPQIDRALDQVTEEIKEDIIRLAPVDTGELVSTVRRVGHRVYIGGERGDYWANVEYGSESHIIEPRTKKALWWQDAPYPVKSVYHPGTPAQPFIRPALWKNRRLKSPVGGF